MAHCDAGTKDGGEHLITHIRMALPLVLDACICHDAVNAIFLRANIVDDVLNFINSQPTLLRLVIFTGLAIATHLIVVLVRHFASRVMASQENRRHQKLRSVATLVTSAAVFTLYFLSIGLILREFGVSLTAYLASASVVGLAIGFGSQGVVQDVVTGLTFIFSDLVDVGDLVEISGQTGMVKAITMRFVELENGMGATVFIPNRTINNIINYPRGYVRCLVDISLPGNEAQREAMEAEADRLMNSVYQQYPGIMMSKPAKEGRINPTADKEILRIKFRVWPGRGKPIETDFYQELIAELTEIYPDYKSWMVSVNYEIEQRVRHQAQSWLLRSITDRSERK